MKSKNGMELFNHDKTIIVLLKLQELKEKEHLDSIYSTRLQEIIPTHAKLKEIYRVLEEQDLIKISGDGKNPRNKLVSLTLKGETVCTFIKYVLDILNDKELTADVELSSEEYQKILADGILRTLHGKEKPFVFVDHPEEQTMYVHMSTTKPEYREDED